VEWLERDLPQDVHRPIDRTLVARIAPLIRERIKLLSEAVGYCDFFFTEALDYPREELLGKAYRDRQDDAKRALAAAADRLRDIGWTHDAIEQAMRELSDDLQVKAGDLFSLVRVAVTGKRVTPPLFESMEILGRERCLHRIQAAIAKL
jgi:glutamyl-tRNA synthetase